MNIEIFFNSSSLWQTDLITLVASGFILIVSIIFIMVAIWKALHRNESFKYEFITIIAHKYRTPMTQVKWLAENLLSGETDPYKKESLKSINQSNDNLIKLTNSLIEITDSDRAALTSYSFEKASICDLVRNTAEQLKTSFHEKNIFFSVNCGLEDIKCKIDRQRIEFVIQSLLENARSYTPVGKDVAVTITRSHRKVTISVEDRGMGISQEEMPFIFTKFFRSESARRIDTDGFGISLFLSQAIIRRHGGKLLVSSSGKDRGAKFDVILKVAK